MGEIRKSVAWREEWQERFQSLDLENKDELLAFFEWWMDGIILAIIVRLESFPPDDERLPRYLASLKTRWLIRDLRLCKKAGISMDLARDITKFIVETFDEMNRTLTGHSELPDRTTVEELKAGFRKRVIEAN